MSKLEAAVPRIAMPVVLEGISGFSIIRWCSSTVSSGPMQGPFLASAVVCECFGDQATTVVIATVADQVQHPHPARVSSRGGLGACSKLEM